MNKGVIDFEDGSRQLHARGTVPRRICNKLSFSDEHSLLGCMAEYLNFIGFLDGHKSWVTSISTIPGKPNTVLSASRDRKLIVWNITPDTDELGSVQQTLSGHIGPVVSAVLSNCGEFALSASWDKTMRLWDVKTGEDVRVFKGHTSDVNSVSFSADNRMIVSGSRDKTIKLWNTLAECKYTISEDMHRDWISSVYQVPSEKNPLIVSGGWDKLVKLWSLKNCKHKADLVGHTGAVYCTASSPDGSLCASGGKDGAVIVWNVEDAKHLYSLDCGCAIYCLAFNPQTSNLAVATGTSIKVWDCNIKSLVIELIPDDPPENGVPWCVSLAWSCNGEILFAGLTDGMIYVYDCSVKRLSHSCPKDW